MINNNAIVNFRKQILFYQKSRFKKIIRKPLHLCGSKILELLSKLSKTSIRVSVKTFWGDKMFVIIPEVVSLHIYKYGFFEEGLTQMILEYLKPGMIFFDIGGHFGYYTLLGSYCVGDNGQVHSFEPTPSTYSILKINACKKKNVKLNNFALSSKKGEVFINDYGVEYSAFNSIYEARLPKENIVKLNPLKYRVQSMSIDEYVETTGAKPDFVKIDAESAEYEILIGMEKTIKKYHPIITIEVGDFGIVGVPASKELIRHVVSKGYTPYEFSGNGLKIHTLKESYQYDNILFLPQK